MPVYYNEQGKISSVEFSDDFGVAPSLLGAAEWKPNSGLSIITGVNGSGKSQLLNLLNKSSPRQNRKIIYVDSYFNPRSYNSSEYTDGQNLIQKLDRQSGRDEFIQAYNSRKLSDESKEHPDNNIEITIIDDILSTTNAKNINDHDWIIDKAKEIINSKILLFVPKIASDTNPTKIFQSVFSAYCELKKACNNARPTYDSLIKYYKKKHMPESNAGQNWSENQIYEALSEESIGEYKAKSMKDTWESNMTPWDEVNASLEKFSNVFKHRLYYDDVRNEVKFIPIDSSENINIAIENLSSGEKTILSLLSWQYAQIGHCDRNDLTIKRRIKKTDIILLDETDAHLDPKLLKVFMDVIREVFVKSGIQVIMTTHRIDTVALSSKDELFVIEQKVGKQKEIKHCHKMQALARLSRNTAEFTGFHPKVYTEAFDDALFYQNIYRLLLKSQEDGIVSAGDAGRLLSRRWIPQFQSVCFSDGLGGGKTVIPSLIRREYAFYNNHLSLPNNIYPPKVHIPFAIIDYDWGEAFASVSQNLHQDKDLIQRFSILKRHSLENYLYDPFFLSSLLNKDEVDKHVGNKSIRNALLKMKEVDILYGPDQYFLAVDSSVKEIGFLHLLKKVIQGDTTNHKSAIYRKNNSGLSNEEFGNIKSQIFQELKPFLLSEKMRTLINEALYTKDDLDIIVISVLISYEIESIMDKSFPDLECKYYSFYTKLSNSVNNTIIPSSDTVPISFPSSDTVPISLFGYGMIKEYMYPRSFLLYKGHDIEDSFLLVNEADRDNINNYSRFSKFILDKLSETNKNICIPSDLLEIMNELSNKIRRQINIATNKYNESRQNIETEVDEHLTKKTWVQKVSSSYDTKTLHI